MSPNEQCRTLEPQKQTKSSTNAKQEYQPLDLNSRLRKIHKFNRYSKRTFLLLSVSETPNPFALAPWNNKIVHVKAKMPEL